MVWSVCSSRCLQALNEINELENKARFLEGQKETLEKLQTNYMKDLSSLTGLYNSFWSSDFSKMLHREKCMCYGDVPLSLSHHFEYTTGPRCW